MFEIYLREDYEDIYGYRDEEVKAVEFARMSRSRSMRILDVEEEDHSGSPIRSALDANRSFFKMLDQSRFHSRQSRQSMRNSEFKSPTNYDRMVKRNTMALREVPRDPAYDHKITIDPQKQKTNRVV